MRKILTWDLGMRKVSAKMVPRILSDDQRQQWLDVCSYIYICVCVCKQWFWVWL
jgi:hypothetical protein